MNERRINKLKVVRHEVIKELLQNKKLYFFFLDKCNTQHSFVPLDDLDLLFAKWMAENYDK